MGALLRLFPLIFAAGGLATATGAGGNMVGKVVDTVKVILVRSELSNIGDLLVLNASAGMGVPEPGDNDALAAFIHENTYAKGERDPANDLWDTPYEIHDAQKKGYGIFSAGPNKKRDSGCGVGWKAQKTKGSGAEVGSADQALEIADALAVFDELDNLEGLEDAAGEPSSLDPEKAEELTKKLAEAGKKQMEAIDAELISDDGPDDICVFVPIGDKSVSGAIDPAELPFKSMKSKR